MKNEQKKILGLTAAAFLLTAGVCVRPALAYFTTHVSASGGHELQLDFTTTVPKDEVRQWVKYLAVENTGTEACYVRVKAFAGEDIGLTWTADGNWAEGPDGYWYYRELVVPGSTAEGISVKVDKGIREEDFNVIVVQECAPASYGEDGEPLGWEQADWTGKADVVKDGAEAEDRGNEG